MPAPIVADRDPFALVLAPVIAEEMITGRTESEGALMAEVAERAATHAGALTSVIHLSGEPLADADTTVTPRRNGETLTVSYHSRSGVPGRGRAFLLFRVRLASLDPAQDVTRLVVLETAENVGWREIP